MSPSFTLRQAILLLALVAFPSGAETRRALIVGIDKYRIPNPPVPVRAVTGRLRVKGAAGRSQWADLDGAVNDARRMKAMLTGRLGFQERDIVLLTNEEATAGAILAALKSHLVDSAASGDISVFYFAGHGSQMVNKLGDEADGLDETLVPADAPAGTPDIRDKELARLYRAAAVKGVILTVIQDSCHSGSAARGAWNARGKVRRLPPDGRYVEDPPDRDANGNPLKTPEEEGVLVLSASQDDEPASEVTTDSGAHGLFSFALFHVLESSPPNQRVDQLFQRVRAVMQSEGALQEPVMAGAGRSARSLLGLAADSDGHAVTAAVASVGGDEVILQAGTAAGLHEGAELIKAGGTGAAPPPRLAVTRVTGLNSAVAKVLEGDAAGVHEGDLFRLDRWTAPEFASLRLFAPPALSVAALQAAAARAREGAAMAGARWVDDPTVRAPSAVMSWQGAVWLLEEHPAVRAPVDLGASPTPSRVAEALRSMKAASLYFLVPPPAGLRLPIGPGTAYGSLILENAPARAHYILLGRATEKGFEWAWALPNLTETDVRKSVPPLAMPLRSDWVPLEGDWAAKLTERAAAIARVRAWLQLPSPPEDVQFPYRLSLKDAVSGKPVQSRDIVEGERLKLWLEAREPPGGEVQKRWVYVFVIDREGKGSLLFPPKGSGNVSNRLPVLPPGSSVAPLGFPLTANAFDLEVAAPFGVDTFFLLISAEALPNPEVLDFEGVYKAQRGGLERSPLARLLLSVGSGQRGGQTVVPLNWFLERQALRSVPKTQ